MVEGAPLLREYTGNGIEGSNPFVSATPNLIPIFVNALRQRRPLKSLRVLLCRIPFASFGVLSHSSTEWYGMWYGAEWQADKEAS